MRARRVGGRSNPPVIRTSLSRFISEKEYGPALRASMHKVASASEFSIETLMLTQVETYPGPLVYLGQAQSQPFLIRLDHGLANNSNWERSVLIHEVGHIIQVLAGFPMDHSGTLWMICQQLGDMNAARAQTSFSREDVLGEVELDLGGLEF